MVSNSTDIHPTPEGTVAKMTDYEVSCRFLFIFLQVLVLSLPFFIHIKLSIRSSSRRSIGLAGMNRECKLKKIRNK